MKMSQIGSVALLKFKSYKTKPHSFNLVTKKKNNSFNTN